MIQNWQYCACASRYIAMMWGSKSVSNNQSVSNNRRIGTNQCPEKRNNNIRLPSDQCDTTTDNRSFQKLTWWGGGGGLDSVITPGSEFFWEEGAPKLSPEPMALAKLIHVCNACVPISICLIYCACIPV